MNRKFGIGAGVRPLRKRTPKPTPPPEASATMMVENGQQRAVIDAISPVVDAGRFPAKRIAGEAVTVEANCFTDGHDKLRVVLSWQAIESIETFEVEMQSRFNDVWSAEFTPPIPGRYRFTVIAWVDHFESWRAEFARRTEPDDIRIALLIGVSLIGDAAARAGGSDAAALTDWSGLLHDIAEDPNSDPIALKGAALDDARARLAARYADRSRTASVTCELIADRKRAGYGSWYEMFPRSAAAEPGHHGTFRDVEARLPYLAKMGFDILYFPPIHPIGKTNRKGANNALSSYADDVGSPWAIGSADGGHKQILAELGTFEDFYRLLEQARKVDIEIALDIAFQCAPDHPYVSEHPQWFRHRPDGSVQYAENPPKKYQDIYPFDFETEDWRALWEELKSIFDFWIARGIKIFRVDNPHTKSFAFWEWTIGSIKQIHPDVIFLAEAFTRPKVMHRLAKLGFTQSYTYFTWRTSKLELIEYFTELTIGPGRDYFRPNAWPNTPDILHATLHSGVRQTFAIRLLLAATLSANYGIYGPSYELLQSQPLEPGSEEYLDSEKYQLRHWNLDQPGSLWPMIARVNRIRRDNPALQTDTSLRFCNIDNDQLLAYTKTDAKTENIVLIIVNLDPFHTQSGWIDLDIETLKIASTQPYQAHDLLSEQRYVWYGRHNYVILDPRSAPAHVFRLRRHVRSEQDFDYFT